MAVDKTTWPPRCRYCGLFMSYKDLDEAVSYSPYVTNPFQLEPNPYRYIHRECWEEADEDRNGLTTDISWSGPHKPWEKSSDHGKPRRNTEESGA